MQIPRRQLKKSSLGNTNVATKLPMVTSTSEARIMKSLLMILLFFISIT